MVRAVILGSGMVGATIARDLAADPEFEVVVADARPEALERAASGAKLATRVADLADPAAVRQLVAGFDIALGALPSFLGLEALRAVLEAGKNYVDISFMAEDPLPLADLARARGAIAVFDCGVAPGLSNMMAGHAVSQLSPCERLDIYVGGLPEERRWPFEYKAGFSPGDVIEEYVRPARLVEHGEVVVREALSEPELVDVPGVGTLEAFNTDGLRSLISTLKVPFMREKTMRYQGHIELMRVFRETGLFGTEPIEVGSVGSGADRARVRPLDLTAKLLFPKWAFGPGEADLTAMRVVATGLREGRPTTYRFELLDRYDPVTDTRSMSRTTAFPATATARMIARGKFPLGPGVYAPETPAMEPGFLDAVLAEVERRGVRCVRSVEPA